MALEIETDGGVPTTDTDTFVDGGTPTTFLPTDPQAIARRIVFNYVDMQLAVLDPTAEFSEDSVLLVWFAKTLQNWKALVITTLPDTVYYEVTYNGDKDEAYLDVYNKADNVVVPTIAEPDVLDGGNV